MNKTNLITFALLIAILAAVIITGIIPFAFAQITQNPDNGHYYEYFDWYAFNWFNAKYHAENRSYNNINGHLVTITSQSENDFVTNLIPDGKYAWLGLTDEDVEGDFIWAKTGEPTNYTNWESSQPNNRYGNEDYAEISQDTGKWNDITEYGHTIRVIVTEYTPPTTVQNPDNGHYYQYISNTEATWTDAKLLAETSRYNGIAGYLTTITSAIENDFVTDLIPENSYAWIGLTDKDTEGTYTWVNSESSTYTNWDQNQPNNRYDKEHYVEISENDGKWNDSRDHHEFITGYVVEYDTHVKNPENGNYYTYVEDDGISWTDAKTAAENSTYNGVNGHLVTITSQNEHDFIAGMFGYSDDTLWIGLTDQDIEGEFKWVTNEPFDYSNWHSVEPTLADYGFLVIDSDKWNVTGNNYPIDGYIIEYDFPPAQNPVNKHYYEFIADDGITWTEAKAAAENSTHNGIDGHLVTITSQSENDFVDNLVPDNSHTWIGLTDETTEGTYQWVTGEPFIYTNWDSGQPDDAGSNEDYVDFFSDNERWSDNMDTYGSITGYVIEYSD